LIFGLLRTGDRGGLLFVGRDPVRTPMPWSKAPNAGFSEATPWLPLNADWRETDAEHQAADPKSVLSFYRELLVLRRRQPALRAGRYRTLATTDGVLAYERSRGGERLPVVLNLTAQEQPFPLPPGEILLDSAGEGAGRARDRLAAGQAIVFKA
jgi:alpha-glucosidase